MPQPDFTIRLVKDSDELRRLSAILMSLPVFALDIETTDWWNRHRERIALVQIAFRQEKRIRIAIVDALARLDLDVLRAPLEQSSVSKIIHNAAFDAVRLNKHYEFNVSPIFDTMIAARRSGERRYSLKAQAELHLKMRLDKSARTSDWSRRPLDLRQLNYAALDSCATLLLYENQMSRGLRGDYRLKSAVEALQSPLPLENSPESIEPAVAPLLAIAAASVSETIAESPGEIQLSEEATAILGVIAELPTRYGPEGLAVSIGSERVGLAGWIIDRRLGKDAEPDEETVKLQLGDLFDKKLIRLTGSRRLEATGEGASLWQKLK